MVVQASLKLLSINLEDGKINTDVYSVQTLSERCAFKLLFVTQSSLARLRLSWLTTVQQSEYTVQDTNNAAGILPLPHAMFG
jgi:hypothetical protein